MKIHRITTDLLCSNMYMVEENGHVIVIDPCRNVKLGEPFIVDKILLTHEHYDHISGVRVWKETYNSEVLCSKDCAARIINPKKNMSKYFKEFYDMQTWIDNQKDICIDSEYSCSADSCFNSNLNFIWQGHSFELFCLPGHSKGSIGILLDEKIFFSGDSIIEKVDVEFNFPGGSKKDWEEISLKKIDSLPKDICICPGHFVEFKLK